MTFSSSKNNTLSVCLEQLLDKLNIINPRVIFYQLCLLLCQCELLLYFNAWICIGLLRHHPFCSIKVSLLFQRVVVEIAFIDSAC